MTAVKDGEITEGLAFVEAMAEASKRALEPIREMETATIEFHGQKLVGVLDVDGVVWTPLRHACEALGLSAQRQTRKLRSREWARLSVAIMATEAGSREIVMLRADDIPMWLAGVNAKKVAPELQPMLEHFQREARDALRDHFMAKPRAAVPSGGARRSGGGGARAAKGSGGELVEMITTVVPQALRALADLMEHREEVDSAIVSLSMGQASLEQRMAVIERGGRALKEVHRKAKQKGFATDLREGVRLRWGRDRDGVHMVAVNTFIKRELGKKDDGRDKWTDADFIVGAEIATRQWGFEMKLTRALIAGEAVAEKTQ